MSNATAVTDWKKEVEESKGIVIVDFWAPWCGPCKILSPLLDELAGEYEGKLKILKLNTDENPEVSGKHQIMSIPTLLFFKDGQAVDKSIGVVPKAQLKKKIDELL